MLRSLYSSISGLRNHQTRMDVIGNNIANVNTVAFKSSRVTFAESLSQLLSGSTRPPGDGGGTNPMQVGLGMNIGSIDSKMSQGNLESTGQITDLAIEGSAFFAVSDGLGTYYTRNGAFQFDSEGKMVLPTNGMVLQGKMADANGNFTAASTIQNIVIPFNDQAPAKATTAVDFARNLDSDSGAKGSVLHTQRFLHHAEGGDTIRALSDSKGESLGIQAGDILTFSAVNGGGVTVTQNLIVTEATTMANLTLAMTAFLSSAAVGAGVTTVEAVTPLMSGTQRGAITIHGNAADINNFQVTSNRPISSPKVTKAFSVPSTIPGGSGPLAIVTDTLRSPSEATDRLEEAFDGNGNRLGLEDGDPIRFGGTVGGEAANNVADLTYVSTGVGATTFQDVLNRIKDNFNLPERDGTTGNNLSVSMNIGASADNIPDGSIVVRGMPESAFAISDLSVLGTDGNNTNPSPTFFNSNMNVTTLQQAKDTGVSESSITIYDNIGKEHTATMRFTHTGQPNEWLWDVRLAGQEEVLQGQNGRITFGQDGTVASFTFNDGASAFLFDPKNGSANVRINLNVGGPGSFNGLTQFRSPTTASAVGQNGYPMGRLRNISIGEDGVITGAFTNGTTKDLAQIMVAEFTNPGGLQRVKDSVFTTSNNSGEAVMAIAGQQSSSTIKPGALELSNIELAEEFTAMITTQRGYQANARVITVSDSLLEELVALKR